jgi:hypothetical protein
LFSAEASTQFEQLQLSRRIVESWTPSNFFAASAARYSGNPVLVGICRDGFGVVSDNLSLPVGAAGLDGSS